MLPDWHFYELQIHQSLALDYPEKIALHNIFVKGKRSGANRQIDILLLDEKNEKNFGIAECKYLTNRNIDVTKIDEMIGKMFDVGAKFGILVTTGKQSRPAQRLAQSKKITIKTIPYEYLKDYGFQTANQLGNISEMIQQEVNYPLCYCRKCNKTNLYEVKIVRGFADHGFVLCPECGADLEEMRLDGEYRVIRRFPGIAATKEDVNMAIVSYMIWTRMSWDRMCSVDSILSDGMHISKDSNCFICRKMFDKDLPGSVMLRYKQKKICTECFLSARYLLVDCGVKPPDFKEYFGSFMQRPKYWQVFKDKLRAYNTMYFQ